MRKAFPLVPQVALLASFLVIPTVKPTLAQLVPGSGLEMYDTWKEKLGKTWFEAGGKVYGAKPDQPGPIGGGDGYTRVLSDGDFRVSTLDQLLEALKRATAGQVVFIDGSAKIDCTVRVYIEKLVLEIPAGVVLASDRGLHGSKGAIISSDTFATRPLIRVNGANARITGLRFRGPDPEQRLEHHRRSFAKKGGHEYYYKFPVSDGIITEASSLEVDNCELAGWSHAAIFLQGGKDHHVHHNYIHHNQYNGLGYGVCHDRAFSLIEHNLFNFNRHSIAGTGRPGSGYEARHNVEMGESLSHCFDMHGGRDRRDGTDIAGTWMRIHHNTFRSHRTAIRIRGLPQEEARINNNWFRQGSREQAVGSGGKTRFHDNAYGSVAPRVED